MANSAYWVNCIREIRHCVYGRDNRKPIADAIEIVSKGSSRSEILDEMSAKLQTGVHSVATSPIETWYTYDYRDIELHNIYSENEYVAEVVTDQMSIVDIDDNIFDAFDLNWDETDFSWDNPPIPVLESDYRLIDGVIDDSVRQISENEGSFTWVIPNPVTHTYVHHGDDYLLSIVRINGT